MLPLLLNVTFGLFSALALWALGSWVIGANMRGKLFVALRLKVPHHFIERFPGGRARRVEDPGAFGATKAPKTLLFNPYQLPTHGSPRRCGPSLSDRMLRTRLPLGAQRSPFAVA